MKNATFRFILIVMHLVIATGFAHAIESALPISDKEMVERLTRLEEGQKGLNQRIESLEKSVDHRFESVDQRFESLEKSMDQRFNSVDRRFESLEKSMNQRFESLEKTMDQRFESMDQRFESQENATYFLGGLIIALFAAMFGFMLWDRRAFMRPLEKSVEKTKKDVQDLQEAQKLTGPKMNRMMEKLKARAKTDDGLAEILQGAPA